MPASNGVEIDCLLLNNYYYEFLPLGTRARGALMGFSMPEGSPLHSTLIIVTLRESSQVPYVETLSQLFPNSLTPT